MFYETNRWDLETIDNKIIKLPTKELHSKFRKLFKNKA